MNFPRPWRSEFVGDAFRVFDANDRHLFVICGDEILNEKEDPADATVLFWSGTKDEQQEIAEEIEQLFPAREDQS